MFVNLKYTKREIRDREYIKKFALLIRGKRACRNSDESKEMKRNQIKRQSELKGGRISELNFSLRAPIFFIIYY